MTDSKTIPTELLDTLLSSYQKPEDLIGENGLLKQLWKTGFNICHQSALNFSVKKNHV